MTYTKFQKTRQVCETVSEVTGMSTVVSYESAKQTKRAKTICPQLFDPGVP